MASLLTVTVVVRDTVWQAEGRPERLGLWLLDGERLALTVRVTVAELQGQAETVFDRVGVAEEVEEGTGEVLRTDVLVSVGGTLTETETELLREERRVGLGLGPEGEGELEVLGSTVVVDDREEENEAREAETRGVAEPPTRELEGLPVALTGAVALARRVGVTAEEADTEEEREGRAGLAEGEPVEDWETEKVGVTESE